MARSTYFYHQQRLKLEDKYSNVKQQIEEIYHKHKGRYGYRRITLALKNQGTHINHKCVQRLLREMGLKATVRPVKYKSYKGTVGRIADNVLKREFKTDQPNKKWVTDVTEFNVKGEKLYLSPLMDLFNGEIISYQLKQRPTFDLVEDMLKEAMKRLQPDEKPIVHSDQGWQYQMKPYQKMLKEKGIQQSMSRKANCYDNSVMENFFGILKTEFYNDQVFASIEQFTQELSEYIDYYNNSRIKVKLKGLSPVQFRTQVAITT